MSLQMVPLTCSFLPTQRSSDKSRQGLLISASWALCARCPFRNRQLPSSSRAGNASLQRSQPHSFALHHPVLAAPLPQGLGPTALQVALAPAGCPVPPSSPQDPVSPQKDLNHSSLLMKPIPARHGQTSNTANLQHLVSGSYFQPGYGILALTGVQVEVLKIPRSCDFAVP